MENENTITPFDMEFSSRPLQILKVMIPYMPPKEQRNLAMLIKVMELQKVTSLFNGKSSSLQSCSIEDPNERMTQMLNDIKNYCSDKEKENIDMALTMMQMFSTYEMLSH
ncbi:MAG: hypothetical protein PUB46_06025 [Lachnospiraceae bacterium]|nr:hypothetical protein [Lachnospiraceae bacterium]MDD6169622.1 hypothetical protein [Lachnospiraceae bacterium]MDY4838661.1 hypothetical protein [Lachnospiraceae bacterium]